MAQYNQLGRPLLVSSASPSISIRDIKDCKVSVGHKMNDHRSGDSRYMRGSVGQDESKVTLTTTNMAALGWVCGMEVTNLAIALKGPGATVSSAGVVTDQTTAVGYTCTNCRVTSPFKVSAKGDGTPAEFELEFTPAIVEATDVDPVTALSLSYSLPTPVQAEYYQLGKPTSIVFTPLSGSATTITSLSELTFTFAPKLNAYFGNRRYPRYTVGQDETTVEFSTTDARALTLAQGMEVSAITLVIGGIQATSNADTTVNAQGAQSFTAVVSAARVVDVVEVSANGESREPTEYKVKLMAAIPENGTGVGQDPTVSWTIVAGA